MLVIFWAAMVTKMVKCLDSTCRYNIPVLAKKYKVYALDLLGFGWSEKAIIEYDAIIWRDQVIGFMKDIVKDPAILVGNRYQQPSYYSFFVIFRCKIAIAFEV